LFANWQKPGKDIWHPFNTNVFVDNSDISLYDLWSLNQEYDFKTHGTCLYDVAIKNKVDTSEEGFYAFHLDCTKLVNFIKKKIKNRIEFISSEVTSVQRNNENIFSLTLIDGGVITSDLYIDCSGFKNLLRSNTNKIDLSDRLFCNSAIAAHVPYINIQEEIKPYVKSEAVDIGWIWSIPVQSRIGTGLVFNRNITDEDEARDHLCKYWNNRISVNETKLLKWDPYYDKDFWSGNVISIGLSAAFIEPLESTGLAFAQFQIEELLTKIKDRIYSKNDVESYNIELETRFLECVDFVSMHYSKNQRSGPFWKYVSEKYQPSNRILLIEDYLKESPLSSFHTKKNQIFSGTNWTCWMAQLGYKVGRTKFPLSLAMSKKYLLHYAENIESFRHNHSRDHLTEITRINKLSQHSFNS